MAVVCNFRGCYRTGHSCHNHPFRRGKGCAGFKKTNRGESYKVASSSESVFSMWPCLLNTDIIMCELGEYVAMHLTENLF